MRNSEPSNRRAKLRSLLARIWEEWCRDQERLYLMQFPSYHPGYFGASTGEGDTR